MNVRAVKTHKIIPGNGDDILQIIDKYTPELDDKAVVAITSKIISICEGRVVKVGEADKDELIKQESQYYLPRETNPYGVSLTITRNNLVATAGIDESNGNGYYILWPKDSQQTANEIREFLIKKFNIKHMGVIITDSKTTPFRWGVAAISLAHSGFNAIHDYTKETDLFGRKFQYEKLNVADCLSSASVAVMGEGAEQTPLAIVTDIEFVDFQDRNPTPEELAGLKIEIDSDLYTPLLTSVKWEKGMK